MAKKTKKTVSNHNVPKSALVISKSTNNSVLDKETKEIIPSGSTVDLKYLRYSISDKYNTPRYLFLKNDPSKENCLIVSNIPSYFPEGALKAFLSQFVSIPIIQIVAQRSTSLDGSLQSGQLTSSVLFESSLGVKRAIELCQSVGPYKASDFANTEITSILKDSVALYKTIFSSKEQIEEAVNEYMERHDENKKLAKMEAKRRKTQPDEDGWVTITSHNPKAKKVVKLKSSEIPLSGGLGKKKKTIDLAFYSFQEKESKTKKMAELRAKFEEDKKRVAMLKNARKFKPY